MITDIFNLKKTELYNMTNHVMPQDVTAMLFTKLLDEEWT